MQIKRNVSFISYAALVAMLTLFGVACGSDSGGIEYSVEKSSISGTDGVINDDAGAEITITLIDVDGGPVAGVVPEFSATGEGNAYHACSETDADGVATCTMTSAEVGPKTLRITSPIEVEGDTIEFVTVTVDKEVSQTLSSISGTDGVINDDAGAEITITLIDVDGDPVAGVVPEFSATGDGNTYHACASTGADGVATCTMTSTDAGKKTLRITSPVEVEGETIEFFTLACEEAGKPFGGGRGDVVDPYRICTASHLNAIGDDAWLMDKHFVVVRDIDMHEVEDFAMIGGEEKEFVGSFDGNERRISNLTIHREGGYGVGLFRIVGDNGHVKNMILEDIDVEGLEFVGGLAGANWGTIETSYFSGSVKGQDIVGGLVGGNVGTIKSSYSIGSVMGAGAVGGLVGQTIEGSQIVGSYASGDVTGVTNIGGLIGVSGWMDRLRGPMGRVLESYATGDVTGETNVGGLVGETHLDAIVDMSYATGDVRGQAKVGGLVGSNRAWIVASFATGSVIGDTDVGGLVGDHAAEKIEDAYAVGSVAGDMYVGGLVGRAAVNGDILRSYAAGNVYGEEDVGGLVGVGSGDVSASYWDTETSNQPDSDGGTGLTTAQFADESVFIAAGWNFITAWRLGTTPDGQTRPVSTWQAE